MNKSNLVSSIQSMMYGILLEGKGGTEYVKIRSTFEKRFPETLTRQGDFSPVRPSAEDPTGEKQISASKQSYLKHRADPIRLQFQEIFRNLVGKFNAEKRKPTTIDDFISWFDMSFSSSVGPSYKNAYFLIQELRKKRGVESMELVYNYLKDTTVSNSDKLYNAFYAMDPGTVGKGTEVENLQNPDEKGKYGGWPPLQRRVVKQAGAKKGEGNREGKNYIGGGKRIQPHINNFCCTAYKIEGKYEVTPGSGGVGVISGNYNIVFDPIKAKDRFIKYYNDDPDFREAIHDALREPKYNKRTQSIVTYELSKSAQAKNSLSEASVGKLYDYLLKLSQDKVFPPFASDNLEKAYLSKVLKLQKKAGRKSDNLSDRMRALSDYVDAEKKAGKYSSYNISALLSGEIPEDIAQLSKYIKYKKVDGVETLDPEAAKEAIQDLLEDIPSEFVEAMEGTNSIRIFFLNLYNGLKEDSESFPKTIEVSKGIILASDALIRQLEKIKNITDEIEF